uniref:Uncharacterized protein n=1 Tax=Arundo donax TaxID=35708 RepID=A0A0A9GPY7_ARUDO
MELGFLIFQDRGINFFPFGEFNVANMKDSSNNPENSILFLSTDANNIHCSSGSQIFMGIAYTNQLVAI